MTPITITPINVGKEATTTTPVGKNGVVSGNTTANGDTVVRPLYDGAMTFADIRDQTAPEQYSWEVKLEPDQELKLLDSQHAQVYFQGGHAGFGITAVPAHDAIGTAVPTTLSVSGGNIITLTVQFKSGSYVYPIIAGAGWEGGFVTYHVEMPPPEPLPEETEIYWESGETIVGPPEPIQSGEASASMAGGSRKEYLRVICGHSEFYDGGYNQGCGNPFKKEPGFQTPWQAAVRGAFFYKPGKEVEEKGAIACAGMGWDTSPISVYFVEPAYQCHYGPKTSDGNGGATATAGHYLRAQAHWKLGHRAKCLEGCPGENPAIWEGRAIELHLWPSGIVDETVPN